LVATGQRDTPMARCVVDLILIRVMLNGMAYLRGRTCLCNGDPKCRHCHRMKQDPRWKAEHLPSGEIRWTMPCGREHLTEPTRYPI